MKQLPVLTKWSSIIKGKFRRKFRSFALIIIIIVYILSLPLTIFAQTTIEPTTKESFDILKKGQTYIEEKQKEIEQGIIKEVQEEVKEAWQQAIDKAKEGIKNKVKQFIEKVIDSLINLLEKIKHGLGL